LNPDATINVMVVYPNGLAVTYGHADDLGNRTRISSQQFPNYGAAVLAAAEYEENQRNDRSRKAK
jgi:hypothetical protein